MKEFEDIMNREENKVIIADLKYKMKTTKRVANEYDDIHVERDDGKEMLDVADLIVENKLLID